MTAKNKRSENQINDFMNICELKKNLVKKSEKNKKERVSFGSKYYNLIEKKLEAIIQDTIEDDEILIDE